MLNEVVPDPIHQFCLYSMEDAETDRRINNCRRIKPTQSPVQNPLYTTPFKQLRVHWPALQMRSASYTHT